MVNKKSENAPDLAESGRLGPHVQDQIGDRLKQSYADLVEVPLPDKIVELLKELKRRESAK